MIDGRAAAPDDVLVKFRAPTAAALDTEVDRPAFSVSQSGQDFTGGQN